MDATCNVQDSIHVFHLVHNMCPGFWVHIIIREGSFISCNSNYWSFFHAFSIYFHSFSRLIVTQFQARLNGEFLKEGLLF